MTTFFGRNLKHLRQKTNLTNAEFSSSIGFGISQWNNYENSISFPKFLDLIEIAKYFGVSEADLIHKNLEDVNLSTKNSVEDKSQNVNPNVNLHVNQITNYSQKEAVEMVVNEADSTYHTYPDKYNVFDFESRAAAGSGLAILEADKTRIKPNLYLPGLGAGIHIRCPIGGDSMHTTIKNGDKVVSTLITDRNEIQSGYIYVILEKNDDLACKRVYFDGEDTIELVSDNDVYRPYKRHLSDVSCMLKVREVHSTDLRPYWNDLRRDMQEMKGEMSDLKRLFRTIQKG